MESKENFTDICKSKVILHLTDKQIAQAIIEHLPHFTQQDAEPFEQAAKLVDTLNGILSHGRSVSTLLRSSEAEKILSKDILFQLHQREDLASHQVQSTPSEQTESELANDTAKHDMT